MHTILPLWIQVILMDHQEVTVVTAVCGVLMNFSADPDHMQLFSQFGALDKLLEWYVCTQMPACLCLSALPVALLIPNTHAPPRNCQAPTQMLTIRLAL